MTEHERRVWIAEYLQKHPIRSVPPVALPMALHAAMEAEAEQHPKASDPLTEEQYSAWCELFRTYTDQGVPPQNAVRYADYAVAAMAARAPKE